MVKTFKPYINITLIISGVYVVFSMVLGLILNNGLIICLSWNMILASMVYLLSVLTHILYKKKTHKIWILLSGFVYVIFFPNSFYILTDFIHFQNYNFFSSYLTSYTFEIYDWYVFFDIVIGALIGIKLGILSIAQLREIMPKSLLKYEYLGLTVLFILSSIGIYLGRFIRLNSWNIFDLSYIFNGIFDYFNFFIIFIILFTIIHMIFYILFKEKSA